jgi:T5SS/PEP-CTERM-associated repeat protein
MYLADGAEFVADWLAVGRQGSGLLTVEGSGRVTVKDLHVGAEPGGLGWVDLAGSGSRIGASGYVVVGSQGPGTTNVWAGADMAAETLLVGADEDGAGELNIAGIGTTVTVLDSIQSGQFGIGAIRITGGADVRTTEPSGWIHIGRESGSEGHIFLDDGSTLTAEQAPIVVGEAGQATLAIFGGSDVRSSGELFMGWTEGSAGQLTLSGAGSTCVSDSVYPAIVGRQGTGQITIEAGGRLEKTNGGFILGDGDAGIGTVTLTGATSTFKSPMLTVGQQGTGTFHVNDGRVALGDIDPAAVPSGQLYVAEYGQLAGTGTVVGNIVNLGGQVKPGGEEASSLTGILTVDGEYAQQDAALAIKMKGRLAGGEYGVLNVTGTASLDGGLQLIPTEGFEPQPGDQFVVLTAATVSGTFAAKSAPVPFIISYSPDHVTVTVLRRGDLNCDFAVDFGDINPFVLALTNPTAYVATFPECDIQTGDIDANGLVDFGDINPFVRLLTNP